MGRRASGEEDFLKVNIGFKIGFKAFSSI